MFTLEKDTIERSVFRVLAGGRWSEIAFEDISRFMIIEAYQEMEDNTFSCWQGMVHNKICNPVNRELVMTEVHPVHLDLNLHILMCLAKKYIASDKVKQLVLYALNYTVPDYFWKIPASSTGKYHPMFALGEGGLARHTVAATSILIELLNLEYNKQVLGGIIRDEMIAAIILHDTAKCGSSADYAKSVEENEKLPPSEQKSITLKDHEMQVQISDEGGSDLAKSVNYFIQRHMGQWGQRKPESYSDMLVHTADYLASRKYLEADINKMVDTLLPVEAKDAK